MVLALAAPSVAKRSVIRVNDDRPGGTSGVDNSTADKPKKENPLLRGLEKELLDIETWSRFLQDEGRMSMSL